MRAPSGWECWSKPAAGQAAYEALIHLPDVVAGPGAGGLSPYRWLP